MTERALGRLEPTDDRHIQHYPLTAATMPTTPTPVVLGINWYSGFDRPVQDSKRASWIGKGADWGYVRGGHAICVKPPRLEDTTLWWEFYDQGAEGACVGYSTSRMMTLLNRKRYLASWLYHEAQRIDEWPGEDYEGTSVRAGLDVLRTRGHRPILRGGVIAPTPQPDHGISENRWATSVQQIAACLDPASNGSAVLNAGYVVLLNSWGRSFPQFTRMSLDALDRIVFRESGEATVVIDRP